MRFVLETSWDDGWKEDVRLAELLTEHGFRSTFYIPTNCELREEEIKKIAEHHNIGGHTVTHPHDLKFRSDADVEFEVENNRWWLKEVTGQKLEDFCYPRGRHDERVRGFVRLAGYKTARTTLVGHTTIPPDLLQRHTTVHTYNRHEHEGVTWQDYARQKWQEAIQETRNGGIGYFHLWGHSKLEMERNNWWGDLEDLLIFINEEKQKHEDIFA